MRIIDILKLLSDKKELNLKFLTESLFEKYILDEIKNLNLEEQGFKLYQNPNLDYSFIISDNAEKIFTSLEQIKTSNQLLLFYASLQEAKTDDLFNQLGKKNLLIESIIVENYNKLPICFIIKRMNDQDINLTKYITDKNEYMFFNHNYNYIVEKKQKLETELEDYKGSRLKYKRLYEQEVLLLENKSNMNNKLSEEKELLEKELEELSNTNNKLSEKKELLEKELEEQNKSNNKFLEESELFKKELEDYKGSRLKYKRLASMYEYKYNKLQDSPLTKLELVIKKPFKIFKKLFFKNKKIKNVEKNKKNKKIKNNFSRENIFTCEKIKQYSFKNERIKPTTLIYADLNLNVVDGSSIWLSSVVSLFNSFSDVIILSKYNIKNTLITSNLKKSEFACIIIEPKDIRFFNDRLELTDVASALLYIDELVPSVQNLLVRGTEAIEEIVRTNGFKGRLIPYLTNFYTQERGYPEINQDKISLLSTVSHQTKLWLWQTEEMKSLVEKNVSLSNNKYILFPPILDTTDFKDRKFKKRKNKTLTIGYAGKIQPDWGVLELIEEVEKLNQSGFNIKLRIISSKISWRSTFKSGEGFVEKINIYLQKEYIEYIQNVNRNKAIELLGEVDYIWSYRPPEFENSTLELSTKLLEGAALGKPLISFPSEIHKNVLGNDYPYFLSDPKDLEKVLNLSIQFDLENLANKIKKEYSLINRIKSTEHLVVNQNNKKIVFASNDYKFIDHFISYLKNSGTLVYKDQWEWGKEDLLQRSELMYQNSDTIFCEWGLANAVWYSKRNNAKKPLLIRAHAQEVRAKAMKFGKQINYENITKEIFVSERIKNKALEFFDIKEENTVLIPNYVLTDDFKPMNRSSEIKLNFGMVGITPQSKRLDRAISLMENVLKKYPEAKLYIKGHRPEEYEWMHAPGRVKELDYYYEQYKIIDSNPLLKEAVVFDGFGNDMPEWYQKINFVLSPSDFESFHYALADGVSSGCLPIIWNWEEAETIYSSKWIVDNTDEAFNRVKRYLEMTNEQIKKEIKNNRQLIIERYGYSNIFERLNEILGLEK